MTVQGKRTITAHHQIIIVSLHYCIGVSEYRCTIVFRWIMVSLYHCITEFLYHCITVSLYHCITVSLHHGFIVLLSLYHCIIVSLYNWGVISRFFGKFTMTNLLVNLHSSFMSAFSASTLENDIFCSIVLLMWLWRYCRKIFSFYVGLVCSLSDTLLIIFLSIINLSNIVFQISVCPSIITIIHYLHLRAQVVIHSLCTLYVVN